MTDLSEIERDQLQRLVRQEDIRSSDRPTDKARTRLKRLGFITYDREAARWVILDAGRVAVSSQLRPQGE